MNMRLLGAPTIKDITREMVDASCIHTHLVAVPDDRLFHQIVCFLASSVVLSLIYLSDESIEGARLKEIKAKM